MCKINFFRVVSIDCTHGTNGYDYKLVTVLVKDETHKGVPVAHCICTRENKDVLITFLTEVCKMSGPIKTEYILTDDAPQVNILDYKPYADILNHEYNCIPNIFILMEFSQITYALTVFQCLGGSHV